MAFPRTCKLSSVVIFGIFAAICFVSVTASAYRPTSPRIIYKDLDNNGAVGIVSGSTEWEIEMFFKKTINYAELMNSPVAKELRAMEERRHEINWKQPESHVEVNAILERAEKESHLLAYVLRELWVSTQSAIAGASLEECPKMNVNEFVKNVVHYAGAWGDEATKNKFEQYRGQNLDWQSKEFQSTIWASVHDAANVNSTLGMILKKMWYCTLETMNGQRPVEL